MEMVLNVFMDYIYDTMKRPRILKFILLSLLFLIILGLCYLEWVGLLFTPDVVRVPLQN